MALATAMAPIAGRADIVVATSPPLFTGLAGLMLARLNRAAFVLDVRDLWPAAAVSLNQIPSEVAIAASEKLERLLYRRAAAVTAVTLPFCEHIDAIRGRQPATVLIPNGTLDLFFSVGDDRSARAQLGVPRDCFLARSPARSASPRRSRRFSTRPSSPATRSTSRWSATSGERRDRGERICTKA